MTYTRRDVGRVALAAATACSLRAAKPASKFGGVQIGVITYSFRALTGSAEETLKYCLDCGINAIELMSNVAEGYAGAPVAAGRGPTLAGGPPGPSGRGRGPGGGRAATTPEQQAAMQKAAVEMKEWRLS